MRREECRGALSTRTSTLWEKKQKNRRRALAGIWRILVDILPKFFCLIEASTNTCLNVYIVNN